MNKKSEQKKNNGSNTQNINYKNLFFETREALVILLSFYEDLTGEEAIPSFITNRKNFIDFTKNYDLKFVYGVYKKVKGLKR